MSTFTLVQPRATVREWELRHGEEVVGALSLPVQGTSHAHADASGRAFEIERHGWFRAEYVLTDGKTGEAVARLRFPRLRGMLELGGKTAEWRRLNRREGLFGFVSEKGEPLLTAKSRSGFFRITVETTVAPTEAEPEGLVLALLAAYLLIQRELQARALKAAGV
jgi:hypothetical protein